MPKQALGLLLECTLITEFAGKFSLFQYQSFLFILSMHAFTLFTHALQDHNCLSFSIDEGELKPLSRVTVTVECKTCETGRLRSIVQLLVNKEPSRYVYASSMAKCKK